MVGKVKFELQQGSKFLQLVAQGFYSRTVLAPHLPHGQAMRCYRIRGYYIGHGLCLCKVETMVQEGATGELARLRPTAPMTYQQSAKFLQDIRRTVAAELYGIFTGIAGRSPKHAGKHLVEDASIRHNDSSEVEGMAPNIRKGNATAEDLIGHSNGIGTADTHNAYSPARCGGHCTNCILLEHIKREFGFFFADIQH